MLSLFGRRDPAVRALRKDDAPAVAALHGAAFLHGWSTAEIEDMVRDPRVTAHAIGPAEKIEGFVISRRAADEAEILSIAVSARCRGRGLGTRLLETHLGALAAAGARTVFLEVEEGNHPARAVYARHGFEQVATRPGYYRRADGTAAAALVLRRRLG